jgi:acyl-CoA dehydrogenase
MDFQFTEDSCQMQRTLRQFMDRLVLPRNPQWHRLAESGTYPTEVIEPLKELAKEAGLWNLFLPGLREDEPGTRLSNMEYAPLAEIMGRIPWASEVFNCGAPDTGNMELLHLFATPDQHERWLKPLLSGAIREPVLNFVFEA